MKIDKDSAQVRVPPPFLLLACLGIGGVLQWRLPLPLGSGLVLRSVLGCVLIAAGLATVLSCARMFKKDETELAPWKPTSRLVIRGLYLYSRNPIYLGFVVFGLGVSVAADSLWIVGMLLPLVVLLRYAVIAREERYLEQKFGQEYRAYRQRVRRWI